MLVYRVEHSEYGNGPYVVGFSNVPDTAREELAELAEELVTAHTDDRHPSPRHIRYEEVCGFDSMEALREWFDGFEDDLDYLGYHIVTFEAPYYRTDRHGQVTFEKRLAEPLTTARF